MFKKLDSKILDNDTNVKLLRGSTKPDPDSTYQVYSKGIIECDLFEMPAFNKYRYYVLFVDIKTRQIFFDIMKEKDGFSMSKIIEKAIIYFKEFIRLYSDQGSEFNNNYVKKVCIDNNIHQVLSITNRNASSVVEAYGGIVKKYLNEYISIKSLKTNKYMLNWPKKIKHVVDEINSHNKKIFPKPFKDDNYDVIKSTDPKVGDDVHLKVDQPRGLLNNKKLHGKTRHGDLHFSRNTYKIDNIQNRGNGPIRFGLGGIHNATFKRHEIIK